MKEESLALQFELYAQHKAERSPSPVGDGILIFDEVRVQGKVIWNSKNNQILGMADDRPSMYIHSKKRNLNALYAAICVV